MNAFDSSHTPRPDNPQAPLGTGNDLLRSLEDAAGIGTYEADLTTMTLRFSDGMFRLLGVAPQAFSPTLDLLDARSHPDDVARIRQVLARAAADHQPYHYQRRVRLPDGRLRTLEVHGRVVPGAPGQPARLQALAQDVTEREQAQAELRQSKATIEQMLNGTLAAICIMQSVRDEHGRIVDFMFLDGNPAAEAILHRPLHDIRGKRLLELSPGAKDIFFNSYVQVVETGVPTRIQQHYAFEDFNHWFDVSAVKHGDGFIMTFLDVSDVQQSKQELMRAQEELARQAADRYRMLFNSMDQGFCVLELHFDTDQRPTDFRYLEANPVFERQTGLTNAVGRTARELMPGLEAFWFDTYGRVALTGEPTRFVNYAAPLGRWYEVSAFRLGQPADHHVAVLFTDVTERREAEEALRQSEERFRAFVTQATVGIAETQAGRFSYVNDRFCQITGYSREELLGKLISDISHPDDGPRDMKLIERLYETGEPFVVDKRYVRPDGSLVWVLNSVTPIRAADGSISRGFAASIDVTDRKRTEEALRQSEERLQRALSIETVGVIFFDLNGGIHGANQAFERMSGYTQADFASGRVRWDQVTPPEFMEATLRSKDELQTQGQNTPYEKQYIRPDGSRWWGLFSGKRLNDQGECVEFVLDITEQKRAHEDLRKSEDQFRLFVTASSDLVYKMSADWSRMYGLSGNSSFINPAEASNSGWHSYLPAEEQPRVWAAIEQAIERKSTFELEHRVIMADGSVGWTFSRAIPVLNEQGEITEWFGAARDISLRKRAEQELQATNEQLRRTNIDLDNFIYTASHDLRAPIANIEGLLDALKHELNAEAETKGGVSTVLDMMHQSVERFKRTIAYLTDITKLQKEHAQPTTEVPLRPVVDDVLLDLQPLIEELGAQVEVNLDSCHAVSFTAKNLRSVVYNLLSNALKYRHPERPPRVQLRCRVEHGSTVLSVQDNGLGLSPDRQAGLFGMFRRFHSHVEGSGIGLYMVKRVVENMGGRIEVASEPGEGSTFSVYFPR